MGTFAKNTAVSPEKTLTEIQMTLKRYKANKFAFISEETRIVVAFEMQKRAIRFQAPLPNPADEKFITRASNQHAQKGEFSEAAFDQAVRQLWRALHLTIKAKLESVESGIETFEEAFMAQLVLPSGQTMGEWAIPQMNRAFDSGNMPPMLPSGK